MVFSEEQVSLLKKISLESYINEVIKHCTIMFPSLLQPFNSDHLRVYFEQIITLARKSGYTQRGPVRLYVNMMIIFGFYFEHNPLFYWLKNNVGHEIPQLERSIADYILVDKYLSAVHGEGDVFFRESLINFQNLDINSLPSRETDGGSKLHDLLKKIYPQRYTFFGMNAVNELIILSDENCKRYDLKDGKDKTYLIVIMFLFGSEFEKDFFRAHLIMPSLLIFFSGDKNSSHLKIASGYASFQMNNA